MLPVAAALGWALSASGPRAVFDAESIDPLTPGAYRWNEGALPDVTFRTVDGDSVTLEAYRGQIVLLNFWATWCPPCLREIPELVRLHERLSDDGVVIIGVAAQSGRTEAVRAFGEEHAMSYPIWMVDDASLDAYGVVGFPFTFLIDGDGRILMRYVGPQTYERLLADITALLDPGSGSSS